MDKLSPNQKLTFTMTRKQALQLGMLRCLCGHPPNNHFDWDKKACAHCECKEYKETSRFEYEYVK